ncbi:hypothetical protein HAX54_024587 [Datura stramonium]|uniref:histidine kinase n=1 Tax=Datura stramonium TaxID=4076 RepID=A0ABS8V0G4_DATST|nr:hypothetical protein [Datura stramonium]
MMELKHRAEAADIAKSQFLAVSPCKIRTPMNECLGMLQMLMDTNLDPTQLDYAQTAHASGTDLISLINELLDQAKIESGRLELEAVPFDLRVLDNHPSFQEDLIKKGESRKLLSEIRTVPADGTNLVGNSIKERSNGSWNTLSGFPVVDRWQSWQKFERLNSAEEEVGKIQLLVTIEDTGVGIPFEAQGRIFTPFMQADSSTSRTYGGTGIGLSISKRLVDLMGEK